MFKILSVLGGKLKWSVLFVLLAVFIGLAWFSVKSINGNKVDFNSEIRPILNSKCTACHGGVKKAGGISFIYRELALGKGESGKTCIVPGDPTKSEFITRLSSHDKELRMPLGKEPLTEQEIELLRRWISQGAEWQDHWAFVKPKEQSVPSVSSNWVKNPIDNFILDKIDEVDLGLKPSDEADKVKLIRRLSLDITGLPATVEETNAFVNDKSEDGYEKAVDRLLASLRFGEKWAGMWLDLARFADTKGYEKDLHRSVWHYRDYVIKSFNADKPYNQFIIEQLAGDLLPNATEEQMIATAFHRNTMNNDEGGTDNEEFRVAEVIDRVSTTFDVCQGITMGCVQCHSHPYDPIDHKEYYKFMAYLNNTQDADLPDETPILISKNDFDPEKAKVIITQIKKLTDDKSKEDDYTDFKALRRKYSKHWLEPKDNDKAVGLTVDNMKVHRISEGSYIVFKNVTVKNLEKVHVMDIVAAGCGLDFRINSPTGPLIARFNLGNTFGEWHYKTENAKPISGTFDFYMIFNKDLNGNIGGMFHAFGLSQKADKANEKPNPKLDSLKGELSKVINPDGTPVYRELPENEKRITQVFTRGNWQAKADTVDVGVPKIFNEMPKDVPNNRLGMANWIVSKDNPLAARVQVNRLWEQIFGYGIVETLEDFGSQGIKPTHPELLDYLAIKFMNEFNWSNKKMIRFIVTSATYRQSSDVKPEHLQKDSRNRYLTHAPRVRLGAEQVRDQALAVCGLLSDKMYGPSVMPYQPEGVWNSVYNGSSWTTSKGEDKYRRGLYTYIKRTSPYPNMLTFDGPSREVCTVRRIRTNTPLQALSTLNDTSFTEASQALAKRMMAEKATDAKSRIKKGYLIALAHEPNQKSLERLVVLYDKANAFYTKNEEKSYFMAGTKNNDKELASLTIVASAIINTDEFITKE
jgi:hypothetical protein